MAKTPQILRHAAVIGGGPAGLMAAETLARGGVRVTVYERMPSLGRKFLMAGRGGLNLTHSEVMSRFLPRYGEAEPRLQPAIEAFSPDRLRAWSNELGEPTVIGTSGRVFPHSMKASPLLRAWLRRLDAMGVCFALRHMWKGWDKDGRLLFTDASGGDISVEADATVLALGGASWPRLGSDGGWVEALTREGVAVSTLRPANCGFVVNWSDVFRNRFEGQPLKRIALSFGSRFERGEAVITRDGIEGGGIYALSSVLRDAIDKDGEALLYIDLRPDMMRGELARRLASPRGKQSLANVLRKIVALSPVAIGLAQEAAQGKLGTLAPDAMAALIKAVPVRLTGVADIARAISTAGGVAFGDIDGNFMLKKKPGVFVAGEMLDWEASTGGYLLQACFATGLMAGSGAVDWLASNRHSGASA